MKGAAWRDECMFPAVGHWEDWDLLMPEKVRAAGEKTGLGSNSLLETKLRFLLRERLPKKTSQK